MAEQPTCPNCESELPPRAPQGLCPLCLLVAGLDGEALSLARGGGSVATVELPGPRSVLETLAQTIGPVPRVLLRDTDPGAEPPLHQPASPESPAAGGRPSHLRLLGEIARGGMGAVLKGRDEDLGRDLAVKVLLDAHRDRPDLIRRFVEEAQIGGQLQHPGIVPIYELGAFADRRPYFAMKLIKGRTLAALLADRTTPADRLPRFLAIFEAVCQTVAYAHARGVIHRDLKPSNIMVGSFGEVQVMDWGLAKILQRGGAADDAAAGVTGDESIIATARSGGSAADASRAGSVLGTPSYMAPEQARGEIAALDERADVFALGSMLCEILAGRPAFTGRDSTAILLRAARGETADALARLEGCGGDAELIGLARDCLAAEPEGRPRDAQAVSGRVVAYLAGVQERLRAAELERARAEATAAGERKRRKLQLGLAASILALMTIGGLSFAFIIQQRQARLATAQRILGEASALLNQAQAEPGDSARWQAALAAVHQVESTILPGAARAQFDELTREVESGAAAARADQELLAKLVRICSMGAEALDSDRNYDVPDGSIHDASYEEAFRTAGLDVDALGPEAVGAKIRSRPQPVALALAAALDAWASQRRRARRDDEASWRRLVTAARAADPDPRRNELRDLWERPDRSTQLKPFRKLAARPDVEHWPAATLNSLANGLAEAGDDKAAVALLRLAVSRHPGDASINFNLARKLQRAHPTDDEVILYFTVARALQPETAHMLAHALQARGEIDAAIAVYRDLNRLLPEDNRHLICLSRLLAGAGRYKEARTTRELAILAARGAIRRDPNAARAHFDLGRALTPRINNVVDQAQLARIDEAITEFEAAIRLKPEFTLAYYHLGDALRSRGKLVEASAALREGIRLDSESALLHFSLGSVLTAQGKLDEAAAEARETLRINPVANRAAHSQIGYILRRQGKFEEAAAEHREALQIAPDGAKDHYDLGLVLWRLGKPDEAAAEFREALRLKPDFEEAYGYVLRDDGREGEGLEEEIASYRKAIRLKPDSTEARILLGQALLRFARAHESDRGKLDEAVVEFREAAQLAPDFAPAHANLGMALSCQQKHTEAAAALREAVRLRPDDARTRSWLYTEIGAGEPDKTIAALFEEIRLTPDDAELHRQLAVRLRDQGRFAGADAEFREALRLKPNDELVHYSFAVSLHRQQKLDEAIAEFREALRTDPRTKSSVDMLDNSIYALSIEIHTQLGSALFSKRSLDEAAVEFREALRRKPDLAHAHCGLGFVLRAQGKYAEALEELRKGHELGSSKPNWSLPSDVWVRGAERLVALAERLPALFRGDEPAKDDAERLAVATAASDMGRPAVAVRNWAKAFESDPKLADDLKAAHRYNAASAAARAGSGRGEDDPPPDDKARSQLRGQALAWLRADLALRSEQLQADAAAARRALAHWKGDSDLAGVRDPDALATLPEHERADWQALWAEVDRLLQEPGQAP